MTGTDSVIALQQAIAAHGKGDKAAAEMGYRAVLAADPTSSDAMNLLSLIYHESGDRDTAIRLVRAAIRLNPRQPKYHVNLAIYLLAHGDAIGSLAEYRLMAREWPGHVGAYPPMIFAGDLNPWTTPAMRLDLRREFNARHCASLTANSAPHTNDPDPDRQLRIGYLGADFRRHSAAMAIAPILAGHDRERFRVYAYWNRADGQDPDEVSERLANRVDECDEVHELSDDALADRIRADRIDILIDLAGYARGHRLLVLARKPAPIIMTGWGHITGLGLDCSDYLLADAVTVPPEHESLYWERVLRLPCLLAYEPFEAPPPVAAAPAERNGHATFGYLGRIGKVHDAVWATWAEILRRTPHSRLLLKGDDYLDPGHRARIEGMFGGLGIDARRLDLRGPTRHPDHLAAHADVDICLDPFPHTGGITTIESLMMGVPVVTLLGDHLNARVSASVLTTIGRREWIAQDRAEYVDLAVSLAQRQRPLEAREGLRMALQKSILMNAREYTQAVEEQYRVAWGSWCREQRAEDVA